MDKVFTYNFNDNLIENVADYLQNNAENDLSSYAVVFGGKRPSLFLKKALAERKKISFIPPNCYSIDEFMHNVVNKNNDIKKISFLQATQIIYKITQQEVPLLLKHKKSFSQFLPWAKEILSFIDQLDMEDIDSDKLIEIEQNAEIGYEVPDSVNKLLENIVLIRKLFHEKLISLGSYTRGLFYLNAAKNIKTFLNDEYKEILFCGFFDMHLTEKMVIKECFNNNKAVLFFQADQKHWSKLDEIFKYFNMNIAFNDKKIDDPKINLYAGFDLHSQISIARKLISNSSKDIDKTVLVLPKEEALIPLLSEVTSNESRFNVSMGYPLKRSAVYSLFNVIFKAQKTRRPSGEYYSKDYLAAIRHPFIKNLRIHESSIITRIIIHKIEEFILGIEKSKLGGSLFVFLNEVENLEEFYPCVQEQLQRIGYKLTKKDIKKTLSLIHNQIFLIWENIDSFNSLSSKIEEMMDLVIEKSIASKYQINTKVAQKIFKICDDLKDENIEVNNVRDIEIFKIFDELLKNEKISFKGTPLKGMQILGLFETRSLSFDNVIILDVNETALPYLSANEPLVPRAVMVSLGLDRLEEEESIQRYQFSRLIKAAKKVSIIYNDSSEIQKSRFIEELIWEKEKAERKINKPVVPRAMFKCEILQRQKFVEKNNNFSSFLKSFTFSASNLNVYLRCPLQFYYKYVLNLTEKEDLLHDLESREVGTFVHNLLEDTFKPFVKKKPDISVSFRKKFFNEFENRFSKYFLKRLKSDAFMIKHILKYRLDRFLKNESENPQRIIKKIIGLELEIKNNIKLKNRTIKFISRIDRIDQLNDDSILIIDYKTGSSDTAPSGLGSLSKLTSNANRSLIRKSIKSFQLPLYLYSVENDYSDCLSKAMLYNLRTLKLESFPKERDFKDKGAVMEICLNMLSFIVDEIYDLNMPFVADDSEENCKFCPFEGLCK